MLRTTGILGSTLLTLASFTAHAGWYAGAGIGPDIVDYKQHSQVTQPGTNGFDVINKVRLSGTGVFGTLFGGYGYLYKQLYLAGEINADISSNSFKTSNNERLRGSIANTHFKFPNNYGVSFLPGYQILENTLFYGRLGYSNARFNSNTSDISLANISTRLGGFRYGLGLKQNITKQVAVRMDYSRTNYKHIIMNTLDPLSATTKQTTIWPYQQLVEFGVIINFDS